MQFFKDEPNVDFVGKRAAFSAISLFLVIGSLVVMGVRGMNWGIDFVGGYEIQVKFDKPVEDSVVQGLVEPMKLGDVRVQRIGAAADNEFLIMVREHGSITDEQRAKLKSEIEALAGGPEHVTNWSIAQSGENLMVGFDKVVAMADVRGTVERNGLQVKDARASDRTDRSEFTFDLRSLSDQIQEALVKGLSIPEGQQIVQRVEFVGPQVGEQLRSQGILAVVYALGFILIYIIFRFDMLFAPGAVLALCEDLLVTLGFISLTQIEFNLPIVAALLTLVGYALNDTIVIFDRVRENLVRLRGSEVAKIVNVSVNQSLSRTFITAGLALGVVVCILVFGGAATRDFAAALTVGMIVSQYSTIAVAAPTYVSLRAWSEKRKKSAPRPASSTAASEATTTT